MALQLVGDMLGWVIALGLSLAGILAILIWKEDKTKRVTFLRIYSRIISMVALYFILAWNIWLLLVLVAIVVATLFVGRFFCGWICPFGLYMDLTTMAREAAKIRYWRLPERANKILHVARYPIFIIFFALPFILGPSRLLVWGPLTWFFSGPFKPLSILIAPIETFIVPWSGGPIGFTGWSIAYPYLQEIKYYSVGSVFVFPLLLFFLLITLASAFVVRRFWCRFCPTAISLAIVNRFKGFKWAPALHISKVEEKCTKCGVCKRVCPVQVTEVYEKKGGNVTTSMCMNCFRCVEMCPYEGCLKVKLAGKTVFQSRNWLEPARNQ